MPEISALTVSLALSKERQSFAAHLIKCWQCTRTFTLARVRRLRRGSGWAEGFRSKDYSRDRDFASTLGRESLASTPTPLKPMPKRGKAASRYNLGQWR